MVLVDTSVWSLALRRRRSTLSGAEHNTVARFEHLVKSSFAMVPGPVKQEVLSGIADEVAFERLRQELDRYFSPAIDANDFVEAARCFNRCRARGISGSVVDFLICAIAIRFDAPIFTTDKDFDRYASHLSIRLY